jgi:hypothetical protein
MGHRLPAGRCPEIERLRQQGRRAGSFEHRKISTPARDDCAGGGGAHSRKQHRHRDTGVDDARLLANVFDLRSDVVTRCAQRGRHGALKTCRGVEDTDRGVTMRNVARVTVDPDASGIRASVSHLIEHSGQQRAKLLMQRGISQMQSDNPTHCEFLSGLRLQ